MAALLQGGAALAHAMRRIADETPRMFERMRARAPRLRLHGEAGSSRHARAGFRFRINRVLVLVLVKSLL